MSRLVGVALLSAGLILVAGCSSSKSAGSATTTTSTSTASGSAATSSTVPHFSGSASSKYCNLAKQFSQAITPNLSGNAKQLFSEFDTESAPFVSDAPSAIKGDVETVVNVIKQLQTEFQAVNYDATKLTAADLAPVEAPSFSTATTRINDYDVQVCGLTPTTTPATPTT
jgi:hypothetical protein